MPFPVISSSYPGGGKPSADFGGPVLFGKIKDQGVPTGAQVFPSGTLLIQSTGATTNQVISTGAINRASLTYIAVSTASLIGGGAPPYTGYGAGMVLIASTDPHIEVWSSAANDWIEFFASTAPPGTGNVSGAGSTGEIAVWTSSGITGYTDFLWDNTGGVLDGGGNTLTGAGQAYIVGNSNIADGTAVYVHGKSNTMTGASDAGAWGERNTVSGFDAYAFGETNTISGSDSQALGEANTVSGNNSLALGRTNAIDISDGFAFGEGNNLSSSIAGASMIVGFTSTALGASSVLVGLDISSTHNSSFAFGESVVSTADNTLSLGMGSSAEFVILSSTIRIKAPIVFAYNLPTTAPTAGTKQVWNNGGVMTIA